MGIIEILKNSLSLKKLMTSSLDQNIDKENQLNDKGNSIESHYALMKNTSIPTQTIPKISEKKPQEYFSLQGYEHWVG